MSLILLLSEEGIESVAVYNQEAREAEGMVQVALLKQGYLLAQMDPEVPSTPIQSVIL